MAPPFLFRQYHSGASSGRPCVDGSTLLLVSLTDLQLLLFTHLIIALRYVHIDIALCQGKQLTEKMLDSSLCIIVYNVSVIVALI